MFDFSTKAASLALFGAAMLGAAYARRRRNQLM